MSDTTIDYWAECISEAAEECGAALTPEQIEIIAGSVEVAHENYGMAFYSPPPSDRIAAIEREHRKALERKDRDAEAERRNAETAVRIALRQPHDTVLSIGEHGEVRRIDGRSDRIQ